MNTGFIRMRDRRIPLWMPGVALVALFALPVRASYSSATREGIKALREARAEEALARFREAGQAAGKAGLDPAVARYNEALVLIQLGRTEEAAEKLKAALNTADLALQARAQYALGTLLGAQADAAARDDKGLEKAVEVYGESQRSLESALRLDSANGDAKCNFEMAGARLEAVKKRLEEKKKQEQQKQDQQKKDESGKDPQKQDQKQTSQPEKDSNGKPEDPSKQGDPQKKDKPQDTKDESRKTQSDQAASDPAKAGEPDGKPNEMTKEEARMILDALKENEESAREQVKVFRGQPVPVDKDW